MTCTHLHIVEYCMRVLHILFWDLYCSCRIVVLRTTADEVYYARILYTLIVCFNCRDGNDLHWIVMTLLQQLCMISMPNIQQKYRKDYRKTKNVDFSVQGFINKRTKKHAVVPCKQTPVIILCCEFKCCCTVRW